MSAESTIGTVERQLVVAEAARMGFTYLDLSDPHIAIALITARTYAQHIVEDEVENSEGMAKIVVAAAAYGGDYPSETLAHGIEGLVELGGLGGFSAIEKISCLLGYFARTTCSHPREMEPQDWRNLVVDISTELRIGLGRHAGTAAEPDLEMLRRNMRRLVENLHHLWS